MITDAVQCFVYIYFCDYNNRAILFYSIIVAFQCYRHYLDYAQSKSTVEATLGLAGKDQVKWLGLSLVMYRLIGWILPCVVCVCDNDGLGLIKRYGNLTALYIVFFDLSPLLYALAPSYSRVIPFQVIYTINMWMVFEFVKLVERNNVQSSAHMETLKSFKGMLRFACNSYSSTYRSVHYALMQLLYFVIVIYALVIASPSLKTQTYTNGWDHFACILAVINVIVMGCLFMVIIQLCMLNVYGLW